VFPGPSPAQPGYFWEKTDSAAKFYRKAVVMSLRHTYPFIACLASCLLASPAPLTGQAPDSTAPAPARSDSQASPTDTTRQADTARGSFSDSSGGSVPRDSAPKDTARASTDSTKPIPRDGPSRSPQPVSATEPESRDTVLTAACQSTGSTVAPDLLVVVFGAEARAGDRLAAARSVRGELLGPAGSEPGAYYLRVKTGGDESRLRAAADELAMLSQIRRVGSRACPTTQAGKPSR
jgi:hypothetical protein